MEFCQIFPLASRRGSARTWSWLILVLLLTVAALQSGQAQDFQVLYSFTGGPDGAGPTTGLTLDHNGNLYGTAQGGGQGFGTVFKLTRHNSSWLFSPLYNFHNNDGAFPNTPLVIGPDGALYGTTQRGGLTTLGTVYVLRPPYTDIANTCLARGMKPCCTTSELGRIPHFHAARLRLILRATFMEQPQGITPMMVATSGSLPARTESGLSA